MAEDEQHHQGNSPSLQSLHKSTPEERKGIHELRNQDYVSRLLAATPPYLYSAPVGPNNFFFSDMLRSLVQARNNENMRNLQMQQAAVMARRPRKRSWSHHRPYYEHLRERKAADENLSVSEKPLELTNKQFIPMSAGKYPKTESSVKESTCSKTAEDSNFKENQNALSEGSSSVSLPSQDLPLPPPPPVWYPPIYPPYGIDPLHFFIDLRVSGHIYDRKKENMSPLANAENNTLHPTDSSAPGKHRHGSAFTVPLPRNEVKTATAINLSSSSASTDENSSKLESYTKFYDMSETKENNPSPKSNSEYVLQNLPRLYSQFSGMKDNIEDGASLENDNKSDQDYDDSADEHQSTEYKDNSTHIDVEVLDSMKFHTDANGSRCVSPASCNLSHQND